MNRITRYYVAGHTANGYVNYLQSNLVDINRVVILQGHANKLKTKLFRRLISYLINNTNDHIEVIHNSDRIHYIDGVIVRGQSVAILSDEIIVHPLEHSTIIKFNLSPSHTINWNKKREGFIQQAYDEFKASLDIHDQLERIYIEHMDFHKADKVTEQFIENLFQHVEKEEEKSQIYNRLFGTNTADGSINVVPHLIRSIQNRVYVKGRAGTGKSFFMRRVLDTCQSYNLDVEVYYCSFDPSSIDMIIIRALDCCLFDSTSPHEFFPENKTDQVIDLYELTVTPNTDEKFKDQIHRVTTQYREKFKDGLNQLKRLKYFESHEYDQLPKMHYDRLYKEIKNIITE